MIFRWRRQKIRELDARVADAERQAALSQRRLEQVRSEVVRPIEERGNQNQFAELIRQSLHPHNSAHDSRA